MRKADNLPPSCAVVTKSGSLNFLEAFGLLRACNGTALHLHLLKCLHALERGMLKLITAFLNFNKLELYETVSVKRLVYRGNITKFLKVWKEAAVLLKVSHKSSQEDGKFPFIQLNCLINTRWCILDWWGSACDWTCCFLWTRKWRAMQMPPICKVVYGSSNYYWR